MTTAETEQQSPPSSRRRSRSASGSFRGAYESEEELGITFAGQARSSQRQYSESSSQGTYWLKKTS